MQFPGGFRPPHGIVFDAAFGDTLDDFAALTLLLLLDSKNECRAISLATTKENLVSAGILEIYQRLYGVRPMPVGMAVAGQGKSSTPLLDAAASGQTLNVHSVLDTAEPHGNIRNALTGQPDGNVTIISTGPSDNLAALLHLYKAKPWIESKVKALYLAGPDAKPIDGWPGKVVIVPPIDATLMPPPDALLPGFTWNEKHPFAQALKAGPPQYTSGAVAAVLAAVRPAAFPAPNAINPEEARKVLTELLPAKPAPRMRPGRPPV